MTLVNPLKKPECETCKGWGLYRSGHLCEDCRGTGERRDDPAPQIDQKARTRQALNFIFLNHLQRQREWSEKTFGPARGVDGVLAHIESELKEIRQEPGDLEEWIDVVILALDGAWRAGHSPEAIIEMLQAKTKKNQERQWPDWRTAEPGKPINHIKEK